MIGRFQRALHRGVLAGLQQQHQQQCQQLEVLGLQAARSYFNDYKAAKSGLPRKLKEMQRRAKAVQKVASRRHQAPGTPDAAAAEASSSTRPAAGTPAAAAAAADEASSTAAAASQSSGPVSSPLSQVPRAPGSSSSSSSSAAASAAAAAAPAAEESKSSWVPSWLDKIMDYPRRRRTPQRPSGTTSPLQSNAPDAAAAAAEASASKNDDGWAQMEQWRDMSLETYQTQIANEPSAGEGADAPPRPRKPANRGPNTTLRARMDQQRIAHARYEQQSNLISMMDEDDKLRIKADPLAFMRDQAAVARIARLAQTTDSAVRDLLHCYHRRRDFAELMLQHREAGKPMPLAGDMPAINELLGKLKKQRARREQLAMLKELRDPQNCQLRAWAGVVGRNRKCPRTELPYKDCCGRLARKALQ